MATPLLGVHSSSFLPLGAGRRRAWSAPRRDSTVRAGTLRSRTATVHGDREQRNTMGRDDARVAPHSLHPSFCVDHLRSNYKEPIVNTCAKHCFYIKNNDCDADVQSAPRHPCDSTTLTISFTSTRIVRSIQSNGFKLFQYTCNIALTFKQRVLRDRCEAEAH